MCRISPFHDGKFSILLILDTFGMQCLLTNFVMSMIVSAAFSLPVQFSLFDCMKVENSVA